MKGSVVFSKELPPPSLANATSSTATRPVSRSAGGSVRGVRYAKRGIAGPGADPGEVGTMSRKITLSGVQILAERRAAHIIAGDDVARFFRRLARPFPERSRADRAGACRL